MHINKNKWTYKTKESKNALCCLQSRTPWDLDGLMDMKIPIEQSSHVNYHLQHRWMISLTCTTVSLLWNKANLCPGAAVLPRESSKNPLEAVRTYEWKSPLSKRGWNTQKMGLIYEHQVHQNNFHWGTTASVEKSLPGRPCTEHGLSEASSPAAQ